MKQPTNIRINRDVQLRLNEVKAAFSRLLGRKLTISETLDAMMNHTSLAVTERYIEQMKDAQPAGLITALTEPREQAA